MSFDTVAAFFDDSGAPDPDSSPSFCFGAVVLPTSLVRKCSDAWTSIVERHVDVQSDQLSYYNCEIKSSDLHDMRGKLRRGAELHKSQSALFAHGLNSAGRVDALIEDIWNFLANPSVPAKYIAVCVDKTSVWRSSHEAQYAKWQSIQAGPKGERKGEKALRADLSNSVLSPAFDYLLQRINYLGGDVGFKYKDALVIGDQSAVDSLMHQSQARVQAGHGYFTDLPRLVNNVWFGSSRYNAPIQMADWIAYAVRIWSERRSEGFARLVQVLPRFRGYPGRIGGQGIVVVPKENGFPMLHHSRQTERPSQSLRVA